MDRAAGPPGRAEHDPGRGRPALARDGDGLAAELPFGWITDVWARGLGTCWDRFCLAAAPDGDGWALSAVGPDLGPPAPITIGGAGPGPGIPP